VSTDRGAPTRRLVTRVRRVAFGWLPQRAQLPLRRLDARLRGRPRVWPPARASRRRASTAALVVLSGLSSDAIGQTVDRVVEGVRPGVNVAFVTDSDAFQSFRAHHLLFEFVPPETDWLGHALPGSYDAFVRRRISDIVDLYDAAVIFVVAEGGERAHPDAAILRAVTAAGGQRVAGAAELCGRLAARGLA
jgi:hypothetical protein